jgi:hypothetical protein
MKCAVEMGSGSVIYVRINFHKDWFRNSKVDMGVTQTRRQQGDLISLLFSKSGK